MASVIHRVLIGVLAGALLAAPAPAGKKKNQQDAAPPPMRCYDVVVRDGLAFLAQSDNLVVVDVSDPTKPDPIADMFLPATIHGIALFGRYVALAASDYGLVIADVSDPERPEPVTRFEMPGAVRYVVVQGTYAYVAGDQQGVLAIDLSDPSRPRQASQRTTRNQVRSVAVDGDILATAEGTAGARVFDISRPHQLRERMTLPDSDGARDVAVWGDRVLVAAGRGGLLGYRVMDRRAVPMEIADPPAFARHVDVHDDLVFVSGRGADIHVYRASPDGESLERVSQVLLPRSYPAGRFGWDAPLLYVAADIAGVAIVDVGQPAAPDVVVPRAKRFQVVWP